MTESKKRERENERLLKRNKALEALDCKKEMKRLGAAMELQLVRQKLTKTQLFLFYHTPRQSAEELLKTKGWLISRNWMPYKEILASANPGLIRDLTDAIVGLEANKPVAIDVSLQWSYEALFLGIGFPNFVRDLLKRFYPPLRARHFRTLRDTEDIPGDNIERVDRFFFIWGDTRYRSPSVPTLTVTLLITTKAKASITFIANQAWVDDRHSDVRACTGSGHLALAMSQHPRLGGDSPLGKLGNDVLHKVVAFLS